MSVHTKKPLTKVSVGEMSFQIPKNEANAILSLVKSISRQNSGNSAEVIYHQIAKNRPKGAVYLRGIRSRENFSQKDLEKATGIPVSNISKYESGARPITESVAKKLAKALGVDFHKFLKK